MYGVYGSSVRRRQQVRFFAPDLNVTDTYVIGKEQGFSSRAAYIARVVLYALEGFFFFSFFLLYSFRLIILMDREERAAICSSTGNTSPSNSALRLATAFSKGTDWFLGAGGNGKQIWVDGRGSYNSTTRPPQHDERIFIYTCATTGVYDRSSLCSFPTGHILRTIQFNGAVMF